MQVSSNISNYCCLAGFMGSNESRAEKNPKDAFSEKREFIEK